MRRVVHLTKSKKTTACGEAITPRTVVSIRPRQVTCEACQGTGTYKNQVKKLAAKAA